MGTTSRTGIFIVDVFPKMRDRLRELIGDFVGVEVVGDAGTQDEAIAGILRKHPD
jgi:DNA-binding NarL/FixJ family response regulator